MTSHARTISVNPSTMTVGEKYAKTVAAIETGAEKVNAPFRFPVINLDDDGNGTLRKSLSLLFGVTGKRTGMTAPKDSVTLMARIGFGLFLLTCGILSFGSAYSMAITTIGGALMLGFMSRLSMLLFSILEGCSAYLVYRTGEMAYGYIVMSVVSFIIALLGPGHISVDSFIERGIFNLVSRRRERKARERRLSYKAYQYI